MKKLTNFIKVEGVVPWDGAVETRLEERRPSVSKLMWSALVVFADAGHSGKYRLRTWKKFDFNLNREAALHCVYFNSVAGSTSENNEALHTG
jgi:hypothetical protein